MSGRNIRGRNAQVLVARHGVIGILWLSFMIRATLPERRFVPGPGNVITEWRDDKAHHFALQHGLGNLAL
jgi:hypothetical protein